jgi:membrane-associated protease RseP (regulator of RpoE activity)
MNERTVEEIEAILGPKFENDYFSRIRGFAVFRTDDISISDDELSTVIANLMSRNYFPHIQKRDGELLIHITSRAPSARKPRILINIFLFLLTIVTTMMAGSVMLGKEPFADFSQIIYGWKYSFAVLTILTFHEMGHYIAARIHRMNVTLPYYIPLPLPGFHFGTLGAFIKIKSPIPNRVALLDMGAAGPLSGFIMSLIFLTIGYWQLPDLPGIIAYVEKIHPWNFYGQGFHLVMGNSLLFAFFNDVLAGGRLPMSEIYRFPFIFAGWIGLLVTAINLIPIGQLDGGHILYSLVQKRARMVGILSFLLLLALNFVLIVRYFSFVWVVWIILILLLIGFRHPPTVQDSLPLSPARRITGWASLTIFILCFSPLPIYIA